MSASGHQNGSIYIFNNTTRKMAHSLSGLVKPVRAVAFSPANKYLAAAGDAQIIAIYDTTSGEQVANLTGHASWIMSLSWNWSGEYLLSGFVSSEEGGFFTRQSADTKPDRMTAKRRSGRSRDGNVWRHRQRVRSASGLSSGCRKLRVLGMMLRLMRYLGIHSLM
jgi:WD40 repeat protein